MEVYKLEDLVVVVENLIEKVAQLESRFDALTSPVSNIRASIASTLREMADDIEEDELTPARRIDPNEDED